MQFYVKVYIMCINISENFEGNVNFEYLVRGLYDDAIYIKTFGIYGFIVIYYHHNYIFLMKMMPGSPFNDAKLS